MNIYEIMQRIRKNEFKESLSELEAGIGSISSMLNRSKEATLYFGVKDNGDVIGIDIVKDTIIKIKERIKAKIKPMVIHEIYELKSDDGEDYIKVFLSGTNIPYSYDGRYEDSVREAVINAFVHNDWKNETPPTIFMFDDRFEIFSYGELPYGITQDMIFNGYSRPVNRGLFTIFMLCQIAEQSGHGIPTIVKRYGKEAFDFRCSAIKVTIKNAFNLINAKDGVVENDNNVVENVVENGNIVIENDTIE